MNQIPKIFPRILFLKKWILFGYCLLVVGISFSQKLEAAQGEKVMVVTPDSRATQAALEVLQKGGNAADALVTAQAVLNVAEPQSSGIGGGGSLLFYDAGTRSILFFDGSVKAPAKAHSRMFLRPDGMPAQYKELRTNGLAVGVPGTLGLLREVHGRYQSGKFPFAKLLEPAVELAEKGTTVSESLSKALSEHKTGLTASDYFRDIFLKNSVLLKEGDTLVQLDLARTLRTIQEKGIGAFYSGAIARSIIKTLQERSGKERLLSARDLESYEAVKRDPLYAGYGGYDLFTAGPPSAGGVELLAACGILSELGVAAFAGKPEGIHFVGEAIKLSSRVPDAVGDPDIFDLPIREFLSQEWIQKQAGKVRRDKVYEMPLRIPEEAPKSPAGAPILIRDKWGNMAAYHGTLGDPFGSGIMVRVQGFFLNNLLLDFDRAPGLLANPNAPNIPGPLQRPRNYFSPVFVFKEGKPVLALNAGDGGDSSRTALNMLVQHIDFKVPCGGLIGVPRVFAEDGALRMEKGLYDAELLRVQLGLWGHKIQLRDSLGDGQIVCFEKDSGKITGQADPRGEGEAAGF